MHHKIILPHSGHKLLTLNRRVVGGAIGAVLLDNGVGGQSSYRSPEDYERTTGVKLRGRGLDDKLSDSLSKLKVSKSSKRKNITM